jgi:hypothetical protein
VHSMGAKYPDSSNTRSLTYRLRSRTAIVTNGSGIAGMWWHPQYATYPITAASALTAGNMLFPNPPVVGLIPGVIGYRIVTSGFILRNITAPLSSSGMVHIRWHTAPGGTNYESISGTLYACTQSLDVPLQDCKELTVITGRSNRPAQIFNEVSEDSLFQNFITNNGFCPITVYVTGAPINTVVIDVEFVVNYELYFADGDGLALLATAAPPANSVLTDAASKITSSLSHSFYRSVKQAGAAVFQAATTALVTRIAGPSAAFAYAIEAD